MKHFRLIIHHALESTIHLTSGTVAGCGQKATDNLGWSRGWMTLLFGRPFLPCSTRSFCLTHSACNLPARVPVTPEWFFSKLLETVRAAPEVYDAADRFIEAGDWIVWQLCGQERRNLSAAGFKAMWVHPSPGTPDERPSVEKTNLPAKRPGDPGL